MKKLLKTPTYQKWEVSLRDRRALFHVASRVNRLLSGHAGDVQPVGEGVSEMRIHYGPGYRVYFKARGDEIVILLVGGNKKTQKRDVALAKKLAANF
nr:MAG TPA: putative addiction module killer protein [Caudoviricetes sp.]